MELEVFLVEDSMKIDPCQVFKWIVVCLLSRFFDNLQVWILQGKDLWGGEGREEEVDEGMFKSTLNFAFIKILFNKILLSLLVSPEVILFLRLIRFV